MWTEYTPQEMIDGKVFPRILAMAECLWSEPRGRDFSEFRQRLQAHYPRLDSLGVQYGAETRPLTISPRHYPASDRLIAVISSAEPGLDIRFTTDGSLPSLQSPAYTSPVEITGTCVLKATALRNGQSYGETEERAFTRHAGLGKRLTLASAYSPKYKSAGDQALADGIRALPVQFDGAWQGFEGNDLEAVLDLGQSRALHRIACGFYQHASIAVFLPPSVEFAVSQDGKNFHPVGIILPQVSRKIADRLKKDVEIKLNNVSARYIRVRARNAGSCPPGHPLAGSNSWIFTDEIIVE